VLIEEHERRQALLTELQRLSETEKEVLRRAILKDRRLDLLSLILGYELQPFHKKIQRHFLKNDNSLVLAYRGSGKTTVGTIVYAISRIIKNRNIRILITSKTQGFASDILKEIKGHLEGCEVLIDLFGAFKSKDAWSNTAIEVLGRTKSMKEPTIGCVGMGGQAIGLHWDVILADDTVDEDNCRTDYLRQRFRTWWYKQLIPTLEPIVHEEGGDAPGVIKISGTRYHPEDHYQWLIDKDDEFPPESVLIIPALDHTGTRTPWPEKFTVKKLNSLRSSMGTIIFGSQYQCDTAAMRGEIFSYDHIVRVSLDEVPDGVDFIGVDLAIKASEDSDFFAIAWVRRVYGPVPQVYVMRCFRKHLKFPAQYAKIVDWVGEIEPKRCVIENNAYQDSMVQQVKDLSPEHRSRIAGVTTIKDKVTRAHRLSPRFENEQVFWVKGAPGVEDAIENLVAFPGANKDIFDALDFAITRAFKTPKRKRRREREPGLIGATGPRRRRQATG
jgi:predicted phage terminase large subunit-like protein